jgi:Protein of unknown function (DUF2971)
MKISSQELISAFEKDHDTRRNRSQLIQEFQRREPPRTLYHYTSALGFKGIVEHGSIWCTSADFFNDSSELAYGLSQVSKALTTPRTDPEFVELVRAIYDRIEGTVDFYAACFCERGDLLNQWHSYGDRGGGFCLGFGTAELASIISGRDVVLCKVQYDPDTQNSLIQAQVTAASEALNHVILSYDVKPGQLAELKDHALRAVMSSLTIVIAAMKDPVFRGEEEWRLVHYRPRFLPPFEDVAFRVSGGLMVPYVPTRICFNDTNVLPIREAIIGPTVNRLAERSVRDLLRRHNMWTINGRDVDLRRSVIPLQNVL